MTCIYNNAKQILYPRPQSIILIFEDNKGTSRNYRGKFYVTLSKRILYLGPKALAKESGGQRGLGTKETLEPKRPRGQRSRRAKGAVGQRSWGPKRAKGSKRAKSQKICLKGKSNKLSR